MAKRNLKFDAGQLKDFITIYEENGGGDDGYGGSLPIVLTEVLSTRCKKNIKTKTSQSQVQGGSLENTQPKVIGCLPNITKYERSLWWNMVTEEYHDTIYPYEYKDIWKQKRVFNLKKDDLIWHHLKDTTNKKDIIKESKYWIYTTVEVWKKSINKELSKNKMKTWKEFKQGDVRNYKNNGYYSKDHLEVFIDKKKI